MIVVRVTLALLVFFFCFCDDIRACTPTIVVALERESEGREGKGSSPRDENRQVGERVLWRDSVPFFLGGAIVSREKEARLLRGGEAREGGRESIDASFLDVFLRFGFSRMLFLTSPSSSSSERSELDRHGS